MTKIDVLSTGGTFEKIYGSGVGVRNYSFPEKSAVLSIAERLGVSNINLFYNHERAVDSLEMTEDHREAVAEWCAGRDRSVVIHGSDTLLPSCSRAAEKIAGTQKVVIFTCATQPACHRDTDAELNLGGALIAVQVCQPGVYIVASGKIHAWERCQKDPLTGKFESTQFEPA